MKTFKLIGMALVAILLCSTSCSSDDVVTPEQQEPKEYTVSLGLSGEILEITQSPLSRTEEEKNDLYGIQIYSKSKTGNADYVPFAYGLFDDVSDVSVTLTDNNYYKFQVTMVVDGKNKLAKTSSTGSQSLGYCEPFGTYYGGSGSIVAICNNTLTLSTEWSTAFTGLNKGISYLNETNDEGNNDTYHTPNTDRYYGEITNYSPSQNGTISIEMKRAVFGIKVKADGLNDGYLEVSVGGSPTMVLTSSSQEPTEIYTFQDLSAMFANPTDYTESLQLIINWHKYSTDDVVTITEGMVNFVRLKQSYIKVNLISETDNSFSITTENATITEGSDHNFSI